MLSSELILEEEKCAIWVRTSPNLQHCWRSRSAGGGIYQSDSRKEQRWPSDRVMGVSFMHIGSEGWLCGPIQQTSCWTSNVYADSDRTHRASPLTPIHVWKLQLWPGPQSSSASQHRMETSGVSSGVWSLSPDSWSQLLSCHYSISTQLIHWSPCSVLHLTCTCTCTFHHHFLSSGTWADSRSTASGFLLPLQPKFLVSAPPKLISESLFWPSVQLFHQVL